MQKFTGFEYIKIDLANAYGMDKELFETRIQWVDDNIDKLEDLIDDADDAPLYLAGVMALRAAQSGQPTGHMVGLDACSSGLQIMGTLIGCKTTCENTGLIDPTVRADIYTKTTDVMNQLLAAEGIQVSPSRKDVKQALMTHFYGSKAKPIEIFGEDTIELEKFYEAQALVAPGAVEVMEMLLSAWQPFALTHEWQLPDGFQVKAKVMQAVDKRIEVDELDHHKFTYRFYENVGTEEGLSIAANIVHSIDGMIVREINRRCNYDLAKLNRSLELIEDYLDEEDFSLLPETREFLSFKHAESLSATNIHQWSKSRLVRLYNMIRKVVLHKPFPVVCVHDEFKCHPNNMQKLREHYVDIFCELGDSDLLSDILSQVTGTYQPVYKLSSNISSLISQSNYGLS